ncbi:hypothetical protein QOZ80_8BG0661770 [Eleusine coracana subsp. coracana]|nr:hypothetical protein QOZ80_8BG0661770 [Eleusine coracana subsp. coracana]
MLDRRLHDVIIPEMQDKICMGCVYNGGWLLMLDEATSECFLLSITSPRSKISLPPLRLPSGYRGTCELLGSPANFTVVMASHSESGLHFLRYCRPGDEEWSDLLDDGECVHVSGHVVSCKGKLYVSTLSSDLIMIDVIDGTVQKQVLCNTREDKDAYQGSCLRFLVVSCGCIFSVGIKYFARPYDGALTGIVVHRFDSSDFLWRRVESIGNDCAFLISGDYGFSCTAAAGQLQGNCVYLVCINTTEFKGQALQSSVMSNEAILPHDSNKNAEEEQDTSTPPWHDIPLELLDKIASNVSLVDRARLSVVCKSWSKCFNPIKQAAVWLMHISKQDGTCKMFDPLWGKEYTLRVATFETSEERHIFRSSKDGWVIVSTSLEDDEIFMINPFTKEIVQPPLLDGFYRYSGVTFSSVPTSSDCIIFGACSSLNGKFLCVETWQSGEDDWSHFAFEYEAEPFPVAHSNPVYFRQEFYVLGRKGNMAVFNPNGKTWRVLDKPEPIYAELHVFDDDHEGAKFCYLVELGEELISVFMQNADKPPQVFKLDETKMAWVEVEDIGGAALFVDYRASFGVVSPGAGNGNRIYFPRYSEDGKRAAFYDMETKTYCPAFYGFKEPLNCVWVLDSA